jgi:hypothetical protein
LPGTLQTLLPESDASLRKRGKTKLEALARML